MHAKVLAIASLALLAAVACTSAAAVDPAAPAPAETVFLRTADGPAAVSIRGTSVVFRSEGAVPRADWSQLFTTAPDDGGTQLRTLEPATGAETGRVRLRGRLAIRAVAGDGSRVALMRPLPAGADVWTPTPRRHTTIVVADPSDAHASRTYRLDGNLEPEAFSTDGELLFVIQYLPPEDPSLYRVAALELEDGDVYPVPGRDKTWSRRMPGTRLEQVLAPDGGQLYTLYSSQPSSYAAGVDPAQAGAGGPVAFVHVLSLNEGWAFCLGLPKRLWGAPAGEQAMATSPDGSRLFVVDPVRDTVAEIDTDKVRVLRTATVDFGAVDASETSATVSREGDVLYVGTGGGIVALDTGSLAVQHRWATDGTPTALAPTADGSALYALFGDHLAVMDPATGAVRSRVPFDGALAIDHVAPAD
jgi:hypothetical protein